MKAVELFSVQCTTCRARLKVHNESLIGQIIACLKCGSMVQIVPPENYHSASQDTQTANQTRAASSARVAKPAHKPATPVKAAAIAVPPPLPHATSHAHASDGTAQEQPALTAAPRRPDWLLLGAGATAGAVVGLAVWLLLWIADTGADKPAASAAGEAPPAASLASPVQAAVASHREAQTSSRAARPQPKDVAAASPIQPAGGLSASEAAPQETAPDQKTLPRAANEPADNDASEDVGPQPDPRLLPELPQGAQIVNRAPIDYPMSPKKGMASPELTAQARAAAQPPVLPSQIAAQLDEPIEHLQFRDIPLARFAEFVGQWCGMPVVINEKAMAAAGYPRSLTISVDERSTSLKQALEAAFRPHQLRYTARGGQIVIEPLAAGSDSL